MREESSGSRNEPLDASFLEASSETNRGLVEAHASSCGFKKLFPAGKQESSGSNESTRSGKARLRRCAAAQCTQSYTSSRA
jgi:hypothetical protein